MYTLLTATRLRTPYLVLYLSPALVSYQARDGNVRQKAQVPARFHDLIS